MTNQYVGSEVALVLIQSFTKPFVLNELATWLIR